MMITSFHNSVVAFVILVSCTNIIVSEAQLSLQIDGKLSQEDLLTLQGCNHDNECVFVNNGLCDCANGGDEVAINSENLVLYLTIFTETQDFSCSKALPIIPCGTGAGISCQENVCVFEECYDKTTASQCREDNQCMTEACKNPFNVNNDIELVSGKVTPEDLLVFQGCNNDDECVSATNGLCDCANGGDEVAININKLEEFTALFDQEDVFCTLMFRPLTCGIGAGNTCRNNICLFEECYDKITANQCGEDNQCMTEACQDPNKNIQLVSGKVTPEDLLVFQGCNNDDECVFATNGLCDCANGGDDVSVNINKLEEFTALFDQEDVFCTLMHGPLPCGIGASTCQNNICVYQECYDFDTANQCGNDVNCIIEACEFPPIENNVDITLKDDGKLSKTDLLTFQNCETDDDCVFATNGLCDCANGGDEVAINTDNSKAFQEIFDQDSLCTRRSREVPCGIGAGISCQKNVCVFEECYDFEKASQCKEKPCMMIICQTNVDGSSNLIIPGDKDYDLPTDENNLNINEGPFTPVDGILPNKKLPHFQSCDSDDDCAYTSNGYCDCANGGKDIAVNKNMLEEFNGLFTHKGCTKMGSLIPCGTGSITCDESSKLCQFHVCENIVEAHECLRGINKEECLHSACTSKNEGQSNSDENTNRPRPFSRPEATGYLRPGKLSLFGKKGGN